MTNNTKSSGKLLYAFALKEIKQLTNSCPGLSIKKYDMNNHAMSIQNKEKAKKKKRRQANAERATTQRLEEVCAKVATRIASLSVPSLASPFRISALQVLAAAAVTWSSAFPCVQDSAAHSNVSSSFVQVLFYQCHISNCGAPTDHISFNCGNANYNRTLHIGCLVTAQIQAGLPLDPNQNRCD